MPDQVTPGSVVPGPVMPDPGEITYLVLTDRAAPYLLARVRWPDVAQAITAGSPDWLDDPGLFDLPYHPSAVTLSFAQAVSVAAGWGRQLSAEPAEGVPSFIRRMPANWSDLSPVERRAYGLDSVRRRRVSPRRLRRLQSSQPKIGAANGHGTDVDGPAANGDGQAAGLTGGLERLPTERRRHVRVPVDGRAHILWGRNTISVGLVDLSEGGVQCVPEAPRMLGQGAAPDQPSLVTRSEASVSSQMHHSFHPPTAVSALRRNSPIVPTNGIVSRSLREDMTDR